MKMCVSVQRVFNYFISQYTHVSPVFLPVYKNKPDIEGHKPSGIAPRQLCKVW